MPAPLDRRCKLGHELPPEEAIAFAAPTEGLPVAPAMGALVETTGLDFEVRQVGAGFGVAQAP